MIDKREMVGGGRASKELEEEFKSFKAWVAAEFDKLNQLLSEKDSENEEMKQIIRKLNSRIDGLKAEAAEY